MNEQCSTFTRRSYLVSRTTIRLLCGTSGTQATRTGLQVSRHDGTITSRLFIMRDRREVLAARERMAHDLSSDQDRTYLGVEDFLICRWTIPTASRICRRWRGTDDRVTRL